MKNQHRVLLQRFRAKELFRFKRAQKYAFDARSNYVPLHPETVDGLSTYARMDWPAINARARIAATEMLMESFERCMHRAQKPLISTVMISSDRWIGGLDQAHQIGVGMMMQEIENIFAGLNYFGMIEPAFYPRMQFSKSTVKGLVSWHVHLLFWGQERETLYSRVAGFNRVNVGILHGVPPANVRRRSRKSAPGCICYLMKSPAKSYTIRRILEKLNPHTGEIIPEYDRQLAQRLRPGELVHTCNIMREFCLDHLLLAGGEGQTVVRPLLDQIGRDRYFYRPRMTGTPRLIY